MFQTNVFKIETHFMFNNRFQQLCRLWDNVQKCCRAWRPQM